MLHGRYVIKIDIFSLYSTRNLSTNYILYLCNSYVRLEYLKSFRVLSQPSPLILIYVCVCVCARARAHRCYDNQSPEDGSKTYSRDVVYIPQTMDNV
jgi:hypothetical protein